MWLGEQVKFWVSSKSSETVGVLLIKLRAPYEVATTGSAPLTAVMFLETADPSTDAAVKALLEAAVAALIEDAVARAVEALAAAKLEAVK